MYAFISFALHNKYIVSKCMFSSVYYLSTSALLVIEKVVDNLTREGSGFLHLLSTVYMSVQDDSPRNSSPIFAKFGTDHQDPK